MIETPRAVQRVDAIADVAGVRALVAGFADLQKDLRAKPGPGREPLLYAASRIVNAARASGLLAFDGVFTGIGEEAGLAAEAAQAVELGFDGKSCIHPSQLEGVNRAFSPSAGDVAHARGLVEAHRAAMAEGKAVAEVVPFWRVVTPDSAVAKKLSCGTQHLAHLIQLDLSEGPA
jgi:citrate lyase beta subunit